MVPLAVAASATAPLDAQDAHSFRMRGERAGEQGTKPFYDTDDRIEVGEADASLQRIARSVAAVFPEKALGALGPERWRLPDGPTGHDLGWCADEPFAEQPTGATCTGFLIAPNLLATSAHCIRAKDDPKGRGLGCEEARFVFDYRVGSDGMPERSVEATRVFGCLDVEGGEQSPTGPDWRVVLLDGEPVGRTPPPVYVGDSLPPGTALDLIGHPNGQPAKVAGDGTVLADRRDGYFIAAVDAYLGNSGSPVLAYRGGEPVVVGVLSRGESDFDEVTTATRSCLLSRACRNGGCAGEHVTRASALEAWASKPVR